jgi:hypothetical protein
VIGSAPAAHTAAETVAENAAAVALVRRYFAAVNAAMVGGPVKTVSDLTDSDCVPCADALQVIQQARRAGNTVEGVMYSIGIVQTASRGGTNYIPVEIQLAVAAGHVLNESGAVIQTLAARSNRVLIQVHENSTSLHIADITPL